MKYIKKILMTFFVILLIVNSTQVHAISTDEEEIEIVTEDTYTPVSTTSIELEDGIMGSGEENDTENDVSLYASVLSSNPYWLTENGVKSFYDGYGNLVYQAGSKKIIDVSFWQGTIDWEKVKADGIDGAILRVGYGYLGYDSQFKRNVSECNRLGIPYGVYLYSYAYDANFAYAEANGTAQMLSEVDLNLSYPIYYDLENFGSWNDNGTVRTTPSTVAEYESIVATYINRMSELGYEGKVHVYSYRYYVQTKLNSSSILQYVSWIAEYGSKLNYTNSYYDGAQGWQYSSSGSVSGISGSVDMNCFSDEFFSSLEDFTPTVTSYSGTYDGKSHTITISNVPSGSTIKYRTSTTGSWSTTKPTRTNVGTTTVYYQITNPSYNTVTGSATITISKASGSITATGYTGTYDGKSHTITLSNVPSGSTIRYRTSTTGSWTTTKPTRTNVGTTTVYYQITNSNYNTITGSTTITINKASASVTATGYSGTYDGKSHTITLNNVPSGSTIKYRTSTTGSWTTTKPTRTSVGTTTVYYQITNSNYETVTGSTTIKVNKSKASVTAKAYSGTYDGKSHTITLSNVPSGSTIKYRTSTTGSWTTTKPTRTSAGTTTVYYQITNSNYETVTGSAKITVNKKSTSKLTISSISNQTYTGKQIKPSVTVKNGSTTLKSGTDYTVSYGLNKNTGQGYVKITGKGNYTGTVTKYFNIVPKAPSVSLKAGSKSFTVTSKSTGASGYEIAYSTKKNSGYKTVTGSSSKKISGLKAKTTYYVKVRAYKTINGKKVYGSYSSVKTIKTK